MLDGALYPLTRAREILEFHRRLAVSGPDELTVGMLITA